MSPNSVIAEYKKKVVEANRRLVYYSEHIAEHYIRLFNDVARLCGGYRNQKPLSEISIFKTLVTFIDTFFFNINNRFELHLR